jgi:hypothetical protein
MSSPTPFSNAKPILPKHGKVTLTDGTGTPITLVGPFTEAVDLGNIKRDSQNWKAFRNRGKTIAAVPTGDEESRTFKFKVQVPALTHATQGTILDWIRGTGAYASPALVSTLGDDQGGDELFTCKVKWTATRADFGTSPSLEYNFCVLEVEGIAEGGSEEEPMMATILATALFIGDDEGDWMTVT